MRRGLAATLVCWLVWSMVVGCHSTPDEADARGASIVEDRSDELLPIVDDEPLPEGDIRRLHNCAEYPFTSGGPGAWESFDGMTLADGAMPRHRTTDRVVRVGEAIELDATIEYDTGPLAGEWVRLYVGDCDGWQLKGVRKTDDSGYVSFRLEDRLPTGVYGVVFQNVGDMTVVRGQLWVVSPKTEIIVFDIDGAVFEPPDEAANDEEPAVVAGAAQRAKWHTDRGHLVTYVDRSSSLSPVTLLPRLDVLRMTLRGEQFAVGPVVDIGHRIGGEGDENVVSVRGQGEGTWGRANEGSRAGPPLPASVTKAYGGDGDILRVLEAWGLEVKDAEVGSP